MAKYLTVSHYRRANEGIPGIDALSDDTLGLYIARAESSIDAYCGLDPRIGGFEPRTAFYQEGFDFNKRRTRLPSWPVPVRRILQYRIHISNASPAGAPMVATINPGDCVINMFEGYIEIVPLQAVTYAITPVIAQLGLQPPLVLVDFEAGFYFGVTGETLSPVGDGKTWRSLRGYWASSYTQAISAQPFNLPAVPPNVYLNGALQPGGYTIDYTNGNVVFNSQQAGNPTVTADYCYQIPDNVRDATVFQVTYLLGQRALNLMGMQGLEVVKTGDQQVKRHIRLSGGNGPMAEESLHPMAMQLLAEYRPYAIA